MSRPYNNKPLVRGLSVEVKDGNVSQALRKLKNKVDESGLLEDVRSKMFFEKPTTKRKRKKGAAKARLRKQLREQSLPKKLY
jgi:small subunit ribosomal protein S21